MIGRFLRDESGAVTVDYTVFLGGVIWMGMTIVGDVATATMFVTDKVNTRMSYASIVEEIHGSFGPDSVAGGGGDEDGAADNPGESAAGGGASYDDDDGGDGDDSDNGLGNPGNDKNVGRAGENPNGKGGWGSGSRGRSR